MTTTTQTSRPGPTDIARALGHLLWTMAALIGVPLALAACFGWPLPRQWPDWTDIGSTPIQLIDAHVILNFFVCLGWIAWAVIVTYVILDAIDAARGLSQRLHRIGPFSVLAGKLITSITLLIALARPPTAAFAETRLPPATQVVPLARVDLTDSHATGPAGTPETLMPDEDETSLAPGHAALAPTPVYRVERGDCLWDIAERHLGSGLRWREIRDLNPFMTDPDYIEVGWLLALPDDAHGLDVPPPTTEPIANEAPPATAPAETAPIPTPPATATSPAPTPPAVPTTAPTGDAATTPLTPSTNALEEPRRVDDEAARSDADELRPGLAPIVPGITGATVLATGLLLTLRRRRRRRAATHRREPQPSELEHALVAAADVPMVRWAGQELATLATQLNATTFDATPIAVEFSETTGIEILWDRPVLTDPPAPWDAIPGGWAWHALYDPDEPVPTPTQPAPIAGLVTFGARDGRQVMINLEALGSLSVTGDRLHVENFIRSMILELGSGNDLADGYVFAIDHTVDVDGAEQLDRIWTVDHADAAGRLRASVTELDRAIDVAGTATTFAYRISATEPVPLEISIVVARAGDDLDDLLVTAPPHRGVALVILGDQPQTNATLTIDDAGTGHLEPLGLHFDAIGVPRDVAAQIAVLLDTPDTAEPTAGDLEATLSAIQEAARPTTASTNGPYFVPATTEDRTRVDEEASLIDLRDGPAEAIDATGVDDWAPPEARLLVKVLGKPTVPDRPGLGRREVILTTLMACKDRPVDRDDIQDAIWGGNPVINKTIYNVVTSARRTLGQWDDQFILEKHEGSGGKLSLAPGVSTDLDQFRARFQQAQRVPKEIATALLGDALEFVDGPPFNDEGYDWAHNQQLVAEAELLIEDAATQLVDLALAAQNIDLARDACLIGLRGLPGNEVLYRARMRVEDAAGNPAAIRHAYRELANYLDDLDAEPAAETVSLYGLLTGPSRRH